MSTELSSKSKVAAALLCFFLGGLGIHRFYLGKVGTGLLMLGLWILGVLTFWLYIGFLFFIIVDIIAIIDFIRILCNSLRDSEGRKLH